VASECFELGLIAVTYLFEELIPIFIGNRKGQSLTHSWHDLLDWEFSVLNDKLKELVLLD